MDTETEVLSNTEIVELLPSTWVWKYMKKYFVYISSYKENNTIAILIFQANIIKIDCETGKILRTIVQVKKYPGTQGEIDTNGLNNLVIDNPEAFNRDNVMSNFRSFINFYIGLEEDLNIIREQLGLDKQYEDSDRAKRKKLEQIENRKNIAKIKYPISKRQQNLSKKLDIAGVDDELKQFILAIPAKKEKAELTTRTSSSKVNAPKAIKIVRPPKGNNNDTK